MTMNPATDRAIILRYVESLPDGSAMAVGYGDEFTPILTITDRATDERIGAAVRHLAEGTYQP